jgi:hypothetical protein
MNKRLILTLLLAMSTVGLYTPHVMSMEGTQQEAEFIEQLKKEGFDTPQITEILQTIKETEKEIGEERIKSAELSEQIVEAQNELKTLESALAMLVKDVLELTETYEDDKKINKVVRDFGKIMLALITNKKLSDEIGSTEDDTATDLFRKYVNALVEIKNDTKLPKKDQVAKFKKLLLSPDEFKAIQ